MEEMVEKKIMSKKDRKNFIKKQIVKLNRKLSDHTKRNLNTKHINYKVFHLLHDPFTMVNAYAKISKNKGALTENHEGDKTMKIFGLKKARSIVKRIKNGTYTFKPVKRTWIPNQGKNKKRLINVPSQDDRIVLEAVRGILEAIYEPVFIEQGVITNNLSNNYGFRPNCSTWTAIEKLKHYSKKCNTIIEGDIVSAYNNVDHKILINLLKKRIKDKKFLNLIKGMLKSGIMTKGIFEHSLKGTPQGGIVSPLLFNIYMLDFDKYIYEEFIKPILKEKNKIPFGEISSLEKEAVYVRYADDWVLALTSNIKEAEIIKNKIVDYLKDQKKMKLNEEKTKITHTSQSYRFLGFEIRFNIKKPKQKRVLLLGNKGGYVRPLRITRSRIITIEPDSSRILKRMILEKFCNKKYEPLGKAAWTIYDEFQIVQKYSKIFRGIYNYYKPCKRLTRLSRISYILQYSCAKTLAKRKKISIKKVFDIYTKKMKVNMDVQGTKSNVTKTVRFYELTDLRKMQMNRSEVDDFDPFKI